MEISRARSFKKHLKLILCSSAVIQNPSRSFKTLASSSSFLNPALSFFSAFLRPIAAHPRHLRQFLCSLSAARELDQQQQQQQQQTVPCKDEGSYGSDHLLGFKQENHGRSVSVKTFFMSTSIDLKGLQARNASNAIPPTPRATNYVVLKYYDAKGDPQAGRFFTPLILD